MIIFCLSLVSGFSLPLSSKDERVNIPSAPTYEELTNPQQQENLTSQQKENLRNYNNFLIAQKLGEIPNITYEDYLQNSTQQTTSEDFNPFSFIIFFCILATILFIIFKKIFSDGSDI